jgi:hypothetical protein
MPPPGHRPQIPGRPNIIRRDKSNPINNNINTPSPDILYRIVDETPPPPPKPLQPPSATEDRNLRRIDREARMKAHNERRNNRQPPRQRPVRPPPTKPNVFLPPDNIKNDLITPPPTKPNVFLPPFNNNDKKIDAIPPPIDNLKTPEDIVFIPTPDDVNKLYDNPFPKGTGNNPQFLLLTSGSLLVVGLIIAMNKR